MNPYSLLCSSLFLEGTSIAECRRSVLVHTGQRGGESAVLYTKGENTWDLRVGEKDSRQLFSEAQDKGLWSAFVLVLPPFCTLAA